jgi:glycosyltransferase involved in cell wall biosynthesis
MKINFIIANNYPSSVTKLTWMYAENISKLGHDVCIYYPWLTDQIDHQLFILPSSNRSYCALFFRLLIKYLIKAALPNDIGLKIIRRPRQWVGLHEFGPLPNVNIHSFPVWPNNASIRPADATILMQSQLLPSVMSLKSPGVIVDSLHLSNFDSDPHTAPWFNHIFGIARMTPMRRFAVSRMVQHEAQSKHGIIVNSVINNGIDIENFQVPPLKDKVNGILMFCDPRPQKGYHVGLKILGEIKKRHPEILLASVGNVTGLDTSIFDDIHGFVRGSEIGSIYGKYRYFLMPSLFEGFPAPPLEAMATGACCVLSKTAGVEEYVVEGSNALLFEPGNVGEAVMKIESLLCEESLAERIFSNGPATAVEYSWAKSTSKLIAVLTGDI